mmetsp:Transcript_19026/g.19155  ORF Transcript_19026/g.19155 Transcript_19026/m.19155 type:complete len:925 (-) Transcript_19026:246-3020(-)|eukprot:CAMPEP_0182428292 /NCGR_PEP_ID=MMETSP1167-20130531/22067_1 /TAXON_ID=2988 /ORGANISM="Mallomonas Sp, Strain CCMP3275" /LENGTH=924 /DNA_ID=CAMNT_0024611091 /DNA_START=76 /DNA_END=2850 /DNA_ORIENTATION=+
MLGLRNCVILALGLAYCAAEVTILQGQVQTIYDRSPKLRIKGSGFDAEDHDITLELSASGQSSLRVNKDFTITKDEQGEGIVLKLLSNRRWVNLDERIPPVALILSKVKFASSGDTNLLPAPVILANVLITPSIREDDEVIYQTASNELRLNGTGVMGAKKIDLYFSPPLYKEIYYEIVSPFPLKSSLIVLRLRHGYKWREEPGPLAVIGIDTGGGPVKLNGEEGVRVAEVQADLDLHGVTVETTSDTQFIYHDDPNLMISGTGFNPDGNTLRFANGIVGKGVNFTTISASETSLSLRLEPGSTWRKNVENLPGVLTLLAVNAGAGFVAVGPTNAKKGRDIATVFERPSVYSSNKKLYRTQSHELHIMGAGFPKILSKVALRFSPALIEGEDYTIDVLDRDELEVTLIAGRQWMASPGPLLVTHINTRGDEAGWIDLPGDGVHVAEIVDDVDKEVTGGVEVFQMGVKVYQSALKQRIEITGSGFKEGMTFNFDPEIRENVDYSMTVSSKNRATLTLMPGKKWRPDAGFIIAKSITLPSSSGTPKTYPLAGVDGIRVAVVLADPVVLSGADNFHETQSKVIAIKGRGFTNVADTKVIIRPTAPAAYKVLNILEDTIRVQLKQDNDWLPSFVSLTGADENKKIPLQIAGIDTGAGEITFEDPITIGFVVKDREGVVCDDSCEFAFDGVCDDGTTTDLYEYYEKYGYYQDDDFGGTYNYQNYQGDPMDDYYMEDDGYRVSACVEGTDCTDCGGVDAIIDYSRVPAPDSGLEVCTNTCPYARDGVCDDPRGANYCKLGTDCQDCGPAGAGNFTKADDDGWWDDDDDYWTFNDGNFLDQAKGLEANRHKVKKPFVSEGAGPAAMFLTVLEGMVYTIGAIFASAALYLGMRWYQGHSVPFLHVFNPENAANDLEMQPARRMPITPDVIRT